MNWLKNLWSNDAVKNSALALLKSVITAALSTLGIASFLGCSVYGTGIGATV